MVTIAIDQLRKDSDQWVRRAGQETIVIMRNGQEIARLLGTEADAICRSAASP